MTFSESTFWHCSADTVSFARAEFDVHGVRKRVHAYSTFIKAGKDASHPQLPSNTPGYGRVNGMNGPSMGHSLPHVRTTAKLRRLLYSSMFSDPCMTSRLQTLSFYCSFAKTSFLHDQYDNVTSLYILK